MKHRLRSTEQDDLVRPRLVDMIGSRHERVKLAALGSTRAGVGGVCREPALGLEAARIACVG